MRARRSKVAGIGTGRLSSQGRRSDTKQRNKNKKQRPKRSVIVNVGHGVRMCCTTFWWEVKKTLRQDLAVDVDFDDFGFFGSHEAGAFKDRAFRDEELRSMQIAKDLGLGQKFE